MEMKDDLLQMGRQDRCYASFWWWLAAPPRTFRYRDQIVVPKHGLVELGPRRSYDFGLIWRRRAAEIVFYTLRGLK
jgi:hypothetical protein